MAERLHQASGATTDEALWWPPLLQKDNNNTSNHINVDASSAVRVNLMDYMKGGINNQLLLNNSKKQQQQYIFDQTAFPDSSDATQKDWYRKFKQAQGVTPVKVHSWAHKETRRTLGIHLRCPFRKSTAKCQFGFQVCFDMNWYIHRGCGNVIHNGHGHNNDNAATIIIDAQNNNSNNQRQQQHHHHHLKL